MKEKLIDFMQNAIESLLNYSTKQIFLFHHNDTDGLCSGAVLQAVFEKAGFNVSRCSLEKPYPQILEKILSDDGQIVVFADFAGRIAPLISELNSGKNLVLILDHHPAEDVDDSTVFNIDGELFGIKGDRDISASALSYLFAEQLMKTSGKDVSELSHLGVLGAIGDGFLVDGALSGINREILTTACSHRLMRIEKYDKVEHYFITLAGTEYPADDICFAMDTAGGVGYYQGGTDLGIRICLEGLDDLSLKFIDELKTIRDSIFRIELENLKSHINTTEHLQWFDVKDRFKPMGVKMIGVFCNEIRDMEFLDRNKYLAGFQTVPDTVPGFGDIDFNSTKISMRVSGVLTEKIRAGEIPGLNSFLPAATQRIGGFVDACHGLSAATTVKPGEEELLITELENELKKRMR